MNLRRYLWAAIVAVAAAGTLAAVEPDTQFGPTLREFLDRYSCDYRDRRRPDDDDLACSVPTPQALEEAIQAHRAYGPVRLKAMDDVVQLWLSLDDTAAREIREIGLREGSEGSNFRRFYVDAAHRISQTHRSWLESRNKAPEGNWVGLWMGDRHTRILVGEESPILSSLEAAKAVIEMWNDRIAKETHPARRSAYEHHRNQGYSQIYKELLTYSIKLAEGMALFVEPTPDQIRTDHQRLIQDMKFHLDRYVRMDEGCLLPGYAMARPQLPERPDKYLWSNYSSLYDDKDLLKVLLDGTPKHAGPMTIRCPVVRFWPRFSYDQATHTLTFETTLRKSGLEPAVTYRELMKFFDGLAGR